MAQRVTIKDNWAEQRLFEARIYVAAAVAGLLALALIGRLSYLQILRFDYYTELSQGNHVRIEPLPAARGVIYDRHGAVLAENRPAYQLELIREQVGNDKELRATLDRLVGLELLAGEEIPDLLRTIRSRRVFDSVPLRLRLSDEEIARFALRRFEFRGVDIRTRLARFYPNGELAVHALGYVAAIAEQDLQRIDRAAYAGTSLIGKLGVEAAYEGPLHGQNGAREVLVNAQGRSVDNLSKLVPQLRTTVPRPGTNLVLSIDLDVQKVAEQAILNQRGAIVAIDPRNGDVIALASRPGFDPNFFGRGLTRAEFTALNDNIDRPLFNRALRGTYPPGSTIKPVVALAALSNGVMVPEDSRFCRGYYTLPGSSHRFRDWKPQGHGSVDMVHAIAQSCDVYFYGVAAALGPDRLAETLGKFGLGSITGIDISGEKSGLLPTPAWKRTAFRRAELQTWFPGETVIFGIGQGFLLATPLQMAHLAGVIANRGTSFAPRLVTALRDPVTQKLTPVGPKPLPSVTAEADQWQTIIDGMFAVTHGGTASRSAAGAEYSIAGKTGTAQVFGIAQGAKYNEKDIGERLRDHAWFIAFAPVEDPRIAVAVLVENGRSGSGTAAPLARLVMDAYLVRKFPPPPGTPAASAAAAPAAPAPPGEE
jgi:penicillin-binding protein 2